MKKIKNRSAGFTRAPLSSGIKSGAGFTLLELLMAVFVLATVTATSFTLIQKSIASASQARSKLIAAYLGQEGIEIVKNIRSTNWLTPNNTLINWDDDLGLGDWEADYGEPNLIPCFSICDYDHNLQFLKNDGGLYNYTSGSPTKFKRKITISDKNDLGTDGEPDEMKVTTEVFWKERGATKSIEVIEDLFNWYYGVE